MLMYKILRKRGGGRKEGKKEGKKEKERKIEDINSGIASVEVVRLYSIFFQTLQRTGLV